MFHISSVRAFYNVTYVRQFVGRIQQNAILLAVLFAYVVGHVKGEHFHIEGILRHDHSRTVELIERSLRNDLHLRIAGSVHFHR